MTLSKDQWKGIDSYRKIAGDRLKASYLIYGGTEALTRFNSRVLPYSQIFTIYKDLLHDD